MPWVKCVIQRCCSGLLVAAALLCGQGARADVTLWYDGDFDGTANSFANGTNLNGAEASPGSGPIDSYVYQQFNVQAGQTWTISQVFSDDMVRPTSIDVTAITWQFLSGVSEGSGGTVVAGGSANSFPLASITSTGRTDPNDGWSEYQFSVSGRSLTRGRGTDWLSVAPTYGGSNEADMQVSWTGGLNWVCTPTGSNGTSFVNSNFYGLSWNSSTDLYGSNVGFSMGVIGVVNT